MRVPCQLAFVPTGVFCVTSGNSRAVRWKEMESNWEINKFPPFSLVSSRSRKKKIKNHFRLITLHRRGGDKRKINSDVERETKDTKANQHAYATKQYNLSLSLWLGSTVCIRFPFYFFFVQTDGFIFLVKEKQKKKESRHIWSSGHTNVLLYWDREKRQQSPATAQQQQRNVFPIRSRCLLQSDGRHRVFT